MILCTAFAAGHARAQTLAAPQVSADIIAHGKARDGKLKNFTGIDSTYEPPGDPDIHIRTSEMTVEQEVDTIIDALRDRGVFD